MEKKKAAKGGSGKPPRITKHIKSMVVKDGDPVTLTCTIKCESSFDVVWLHNEKEIKNSKDFQYQTDGSDYKLNITEIFPEDAGIYTCEAFNDAGEAFSSCTLVVLVPNEPVKGPGFTKFPESQTVHENQPVTFTAEIEKDADKVNWTKDGKVLEEKGARHKIAKSGKTCTLSIEKCASTDIGQYGVRALSASLGDSIVTFSLNVLTEKDL